MNPKYRFLLSILLLWALSGVALAETVTSTENPLNLKASLVDIQNTFIGEEDKVIKASAGDVIPGSMDEIKRRIIMLQYRIDKLIHTSSAQGFDTKECMEAMKNLTSAFWTFETGLKGLQMAFEKHNIFESRTLLFRDIITDIRNHRFLLADEKLIKLYDISAVQKIIHETYARSENNMRMILNFSLAVSDTNRCFAVLKALQEEMSMGSGGKVRNLIRLAHIIEKEGFNCNNSSDKFFIHEVIRDIEITSAEELARSMKIGDFATSESVKVLLDMVYDFCPKVFNGTMKRLINETFGVVKSREILSNIFVRCNTEQAISGIGNLFWRIYYDYNVGLFKDSDLIIDIAWHLSELRNRQDAASLSKEIRDSFDAIVGEIPKCARNLFFEKSVCFWNKEQHIYLTATDDKFRYDTERRRVLAPANQVVPKGSSWIPVRQNDDILFRSKEYPKEFLYFANFEHNKDTRPMFSWIAGNNLDNQSAFKIQLIDHDTCYLKSTRFNEYMFASDVKFDKDVSYSYVFAWKSQAKAAMDGSFVWHIQGC